MLAAQQITAFAKATTALAQRQVDQGGLPFSSLIVDRHGACIGTGVNQVNALHDCTAHAEIQAIREAGATTGRTTLAGATLFASGEPCGLCYMAIRLAKISHVVILLDRHDVAELGFDYLWTYESQDKLTPATKENHLPHALKVAPFLRCQQDMESIGL